MGEKVTGETGDDGAVTIGEGDGAVRFVKESDLLALKGSRDGLQEKLDAAAKAGGEATSDAVKAAEAKAEESRQAGIKAEADISRLTEEVKAAAGNAEKVADITKQLETAQEAGKGSATELLTLRRELIVSQYGVPPEKVAEKSLDELKLYEDALKDIGVLKGAGNLAIGGGNGTAAALEGKNPRQLAVMAYQTSNK